MNQELSVEARWALQEAADECRRIGDELTRQAESVGGEFRQMGLSEAAVAYECEAAIKKLFVV